MNASQKPKQSTSRWNFISQAVASVESGLDKILADEDDSAPKSQNQVGKSQENGSTARASSDLRRIDGANVTNDRLQARLAQAMAKKAGNRASTPQPESQPVSRPDTPVDLQLNAINDIQSIEERRSAAESAKEDSTKISTDLTATIEHATAENIADAVQLRLSTASSRKSKDVEALLSERVPPSSRPSNVDVSLRSENSNDADVSVLKIQLEHEKSLEALKEEIDGYLERIDGLQRNLQMLTQETIHKAKDIKNSVESTTYEKQLAEKDERIALLLEEGTKLTKGEMQYRNTIKKLRAQSMTLTKDQDAVRSRAEKAEKKAEGLETRILAAEAEAKQYRGQVNMLSISANDLSAVTKERNALQSTLADFKSQLAQANKRAENAESKSNAEKAATETRRVAELTDDLSSLRLEKQLAEDKLKQEISTLRVSLRQEQEQTRQMETEMLAEQAALESKLEAIRLQAEAASSNESGDSQAKLLRQIETLQSQYSSASSNWQGIESTLLSRITALEKERDDVVGREADLRRKLRDATSKAKSANKELDEVQHVLQGLQDRATDDSVEARKAKSRVEELESEVISLHKEMDDQKAKLEKEALRHLDEEKAKWLASLPQTIPRIESPVASIRKGPGNLFMDTLMSPLERPSSRRSSTQPFHDSSAHTRINSSISLRPNGAIPETPSIHTPDEQDDFFANIPATPASATQADSAGRHMHDVISASTAGAGPSVQLVERLSTNVRRLESEKAAAKDEMARLSQQRDEARKEVVNLMREVEQKRTVDNRTTQLEKQHKDLSAKYQATLELLGEKTEQVEELKADIADVKQMYRHLADTMGK